MDIDPHLQVEQPGALPAETGGPLDQVQQRLGVVPQLPGDLLLAAVPHEQQAEQVLFPAGKVDIGHAGGLVGEILPAFHGPGDGLAIELVPGLQHLLLHLVHAPEQAENGLGGAVQPCGQTPGRQGLGAGLPGDVQGGPDDLLPGESDFRRHRRIPSPSC